MRTALYTCITGARDKPKRMEYTDSDIDYIMFSDEIEYAPGWKILPLFWKDSDPVRTARYHKHHPIELLPDYEYSIWLDATHWTYSSIKPMLDLLDKNCIAAMRHFKNKNINEELQACLEAGKDIPEVMINQVNDYNSTNFPDLELFTTSCLARKHTRELYSFQKMWWKEISSASKRDQLSFTYCLWKMNLKCSIIPGYCRCGYSPFFKMAKHNCCQLIKSGIKFL